MTVSHLVKTDDFVYGRGCVLAMLMWSMCQKLKFHTVQNLFWSRDEVVAWRPTNLRPTKRLS